MLTFPIGSLHDLKARWKLVGTGAKLTFPSIA